MNAAAAPVRDWPNNPWIFLILVFALTWAFWIAGALLSTNAAGFFGYQALGVLIGVVMPPVLLTLLTRSAAERREYLRRVVDFRRIPVRWYVLIFAIFPALSGLAIITGYLATGKINPFQTAGYFLSHPSKLLVLAVFTLFFGPLPEELCWRGYLLDRLQSRYNPLRSSVFLGLAWGLWHLPLFFIPHTFQHEAIGIGTPLFCMFFGAILAETILMTWIYNNTGRSTLAAVLTHYMSNFSGEFLSFTAGLRLLRGLWTIIAAAIVAFIWRAATVKRPRPNISEAAQ